MPVSRLISVRDSDVSNISSLSNLNYFGSGDLHCMVTVLLSFFKNLFYINVRPEICQNIKNILRTDTRGSEKNNLFFRLNAKNGRSYI